METYMKTETEELLVTSKKGFICRLQRLCRRKFGTLLVVRSGGRGLGNLFTAAANHVAPRRRRGGDMIIHNREQVSKSPAT